MHVTLSSATYERAVAFSRISEHRVLKMQWDPVVEPHQTIMANKSILLAVSRLECRWEANEQAESTLIFECMHIL